MPSIRIPGSINLGVAALSLAACAGTASTGSGVAASPSSPALIHTASIKVADRSEPVLTTAKGLTLYYLTTDTATRVTCTGECASNWPRLLSPSGTRPVIRRRRAR